MARLMPLYEVMSGSGCGWCENWVPPEPDEGTPEAFELTECAWCNGAMTDGISVSWPDDVRSCYGVRYGMRFWDGRPSDGERESIPWTDGEGRGIVGFVRQAAAAGCR